ncbi:MAG: transposase [Verrucomicrobiota bacterium]
MALMERTYSRKQCFRGRRLVYGQAAVYHVVSRTAFGRYSFEDEEKRMFLRMLGKQAGFCGVEVLAYCVMGNHFHLLVKLPEACAISDEELLRRYRLLYDEENCPPSSPSPKVLEGLLREDGEEGRELRERIVARMHDLACFMRELKQRFGIWYNHRHGNRGTLWAERFRSTIVEESPEALTTVAAYIDLNPVRAKLVDDPADYRFSSYGRAAGGDQAARRSYELVFCRERSWRQLLPGYNLVLYGKGDRSKGSVGKDQGRIDPRKVARILESGGKVPMAEVLRLRVRYFTYGTALGSKTFLEELGARWKERFGVERKQNVHSMRHGEWGGLRSYRNLQVEPVTVPLD